MTKDKPRFYTELKETLIIDIAKDMLKRRFINDESIPIPIKFIDEAEKNVDCFIHYLKQKQ